MTGTCRPGKRRSGIRSSRTHTRTVARTRIAWAEMMRADGYRPKEVFEQSASQPPARSARKDEEEVIASGRAADREDPKKSKRKAACSLDRGPISELHQDLRSDALRQRAGHTTAPDHFAEAQLNILSRQGLSAISGQLLALRAGREGPAL